METQTVYIPKLMPKEEFFMPGHRACIGCGEALALRLVCKALGSNVIVVNATGCMEIVSSQMPYTSWAVPWIHTLFENTAAVASGIEAGIKSLNSKSKKSLEGVKVVAVAGDGATADIGIQALSGALERGHDFLYICLDNEAYMNTGIQRSSATPFGAHTTTSPAGKVSMGQFTWKKNLPAIVAAHNVPYVATACPSYFKDMMTKLQKAASIKGPTYVHILSVCPTGWRCATDITVKIGRLAVQTGMFPIYEIENGKYKLNMDIPQLRPVNEYLKLQGRFRHLSDDMIKKIQERVTEDYARLKERAA
ncbi:MAG: pyruvate synthase subunit beta [Chloroflexi bacterium]|nr:pyruvate synthase subunit beta [Chloroflexota bacterium]